MKDLLTFTTTAMVRPSILNITYSSFQSMMNINFKEYNLRINIDPAPEIKNRNEVIDIANKYFNKVEVNTPNRCSFPSAVKWCWKELDTEFVFHLEDDWKLKKQINISDIINVLRNRKDINQICLRAYERQSKMSLLPSVIRSSVAMLLSKHMSDSKNPEVQIKDGTILDENNNKIVNEYSAIQYPDYTVMRDTGRGWIKSTNFFRPGPFFTKWQKR